MKHRFNSAADVKRYLIAYGFTEKVKVKGHNSCFTGNRFFSVSLPDREGAGPIVSCSGSREPLTFGAFDDANEATRAKVAGLTQLQAILEGTNASAEG